MHDDVENGPENRDEQREVERSVAEQLSPARREDGRVVREAHVAGFVARPGEERRRCARDERQDDEHDDDHERVRDVPICGKRRADLRDAHATNHAPRDEEQKRTEQDERRSG